MVQKFIITKIIQTVLSKVLQGDSRGLRSYFKKAIIGIIVGIVLLIVLLVLGVIFIVQLLIGAFTQTTDISATKLEPVTNEIVDASRVVGADTISRTFNDVKEMVTISPPIIKEGEQVIGAAQSLIQESQPALGTVESLLNQFKQILP